MSIFIPTGTPPAISNSMARVERRLPYPGDITARVGGRVEPEDVVGRTAKPEPPIILNVARLLGIAPGFVERAMRREVGNRVAKGEVLARSGFGGRSCLSPVDGMIAAVDGETGYVTIAPNPTTYELVANIRGLVMEVIGNQGLVIETPAAQAYGVFGIGEERNGVMRLLVTDPGEMTVPEMIDAKSAYAIIICGAGITANALRRAVKEQVRGVIVGGIDEAELRDFLGWPGVASWHIGANTWEMPDPRLAPDPKLTILVTEGFGTRPMSQPIFDLLSGADRQEALIEGHTSLRRPLRRPRVVIPHTRSAATTVEAQSTQIRPGAAVRLLDPEHLGQIGQVRAAPAAPRRLPSGARVPAVEVITPNGASIWLPRTAVEALG